MPDEELKPANDNIPASPFLADGDKKQGDTAAEREEHPDPAQPAANDEVATPIHTDPFVAPAVDPEPNAEETELAPTYGDRPNPVATEGTTEVSDEPEVGYQFADPNDPIRQRYVEMERQKEEQIAELVKQGDGKPKV